MDSGWAISVDSKELLSFEETDKEQSQVEDTDDFCRPELIEIVPLARDNDGSCTTECVSAEEDLTVVKREPNDVY